MLQLRKDKKEKTGKFALLCRTHNASAVNLRMTADPAPAAHEEMVHLPLGQ